MKEKLLTFILLVILIASCTNNDEIKDAEISSSEDSKSLRYLSILISSVQDPDNTLTGFNPSNDTEFGNDSENAVKEIRFYFFDNNGNPVDIREKEEETENGKNYYDWSPNDIDKETSSDTESGNIEKIYRATFPVLYNEDNFPTLLVAIVNPDKEIKEKGRMSLNNLEGIVMDFETGKISGNFIMSNSVYATSYKEGISSREVICPSTISESNFIRSSKEAEKNPVVIYVERIVARVDVSFTQKPSIDSPKYFKVNYKSEDIYVDFLGWAITSSPKTSRLLKKIEPDWKDTEFFTSSYSWNVPEYHRSLWSVNPETIDYNWFSYKDLTGLDGSDNPKEKTKGCYDVDISNKMIAYTQENANPFKSGKIDIANPTYPSKVIFAAQLLDNNGDPKTIAEYGGENYTLEGLKIKIAETVGNAMMYKNGNTFIGLSPEDLEFVTSMQHNGEEGPDSEGTYYVYYHLTEEALNSRTWYSDETHVIQYPNVYINELVSPAKIWNKGYTYYYFDIPHFGNEDEVLLGVVRNFLYDATIDEILTLGTPVYDPNEKIYPETPPKEIPLKVTVKPLRWRVESQDVTFTW